MRPVDLSVLISMLDKHEIRFAFGGHPEVIVLFEPHAFSGIVLRKGRIGNDNVEPFQLRALIHGLRDRNNEFKGFVTYRLGLNPIVLEEISETSGTVGVRQFWRGQLPIILALMIRALRHGYIAQGIYGTFVLTIPAFGIGNFVLPHRSSVLTIHCLSSN